MVNKYLFLAYTFAWLIFVLYAWNLSRRQARLRKELEELKRKVSEPSSTSSSVAQNS
ncbi:MAG: CcmD family protein [Acidobacteria bacterium]|nr:CcmD family protein [Acidobacteriota bacterium]